MGPGAGPLGVFTAVFGTPLDDGHVLRWRVTGREPAPELVEPLSWTFWERIRERSALDYLLARTQLDCDIPRDHRALEEVRRGAHPRSGRAPGPDRRDRLVQRRSVGGLRGAPRASRPTPRSSTSPASRRSRCRSTRATTGSQPRSSSPGAPPTRPRCSRSRLSSRQLARGPTAAPSSPRPSARSVRQRRPAAPRGRGRT